ncbi:MAG: peptidase C11 [Deltaproteobacteria bacterium CG03_land_8_20_14_0_80_45_14]|nr:MAG: peptidase C11 [Deltaproteobacteria bacterium CG03_land_8_20_14_0_80_45_14]
MPKVTEKEWTVMVYLAGDNNLDSAGVIDLKEMKKVGSTEQINVIAQFDREGKSIATNRYYIRKGGTLAKDVVGSLGETNMGNPRVLEDFIKWGIKNYPAEHYLVVVWNHGNGWNDENVYRVARNMMKLNIKRRGEVVLPAKGAQKDSVSIRRIHAIGGKKFRHALFHTSIMKAITIRGIAYDDDAQDFLDNIEMKRLLGSTKKILKRKIDILGMDACMMSMAEVVYQLRDSVSLTVGSEEVEPGDGWPYDRILAKLAKKPAMPPNELATTIVNGYVASYPANAGVTQSACDLSKAGLLASAVDQLADVLNSHLSDAAVRATVIECRLQTQAYDTPDYIDLYDFCNLLENKTGFDDIRAACSAVKNMIQRNGVVIRSGYKGKNVKHSNGLSIYFPQKSLSSLYATLDFTKKTSWGKFLERFISYTRRPD